MKIRRMPLHLLLGLLLLAASASPALGTAIYIDSLTDDGTGCTLREAVESANTDTSVGGCAAGDGWDSIYFDVTGTIQLTDVINVSRDVSIYGPSIEPNGVERPGGVTVQAAPGKRAFVFYSGGLSIQYTLSSLTVRGPDSGEGGGIEVLQGDDLTISHCTLTGSRWVDGGAIFNFDGYLAVEASLITGNSASGSGGGIYSSGFGYLVIDNSIIAGNTAALEGGGVWSGNETAIRESTLNGNSAGVSGGGVQLTGNVLYKIIANSILWGNQAPADPQIGYTGNVPDVTYCDIEGATPWPGTGNIAADPQFISARPASEAPTAAGDCHLRHTSPCVNAGGVFWTEYDIDGDVRCQDAAVDIGADEAGPPYNDSFEYGTGVPAPWLGRNLAAIDRRVTRARRFGRASFRFVGSPAAKSLRQVLPITVDQYHVLTLSGWSKASGTSPSGGPYRIEARVFYDDGTSERLKVSFAKSSHPWTYAERNMRADHNVTGVVIYLRYARQTGTAWFDAVKLYVTSSPVGVSAGGLPAR